MKKQNAHRGISSGLTVASIATCTIVMAAFPARAACKLFYASERQVRDLQASKAEIPGLGKGVNKVLQSSFNFLNKVDHATLGLVSAATTRGAFTFDRIKPKEWESMNVVGTVVYQESAFASVPLRGAKLTFSEGETKRTVTTGAQGEFAEYFYKIVPYKRLRLFPGPILEIGTENKATLAVPIDVTLESKFCTAKTTIREIPLEPLVFIGTDKE